MVRDNVYKSKDPQLDFVSHNLCIQFSKFSHVSFLNVEYQHLYVFVKDQSDDILPKILHLITRKILLQYFNFILSKRSNAIFLNLKNIIVLCLDQRIINDFCIIYLFPNIEILSYKDLEILSRCLTIQDNKQMANCTLLYCLKYFATMLFIA